MQIRFSVRRVLAGFLLLGASLAIFRRIPYLEFGLAIGAMVGMSFFALALVARKSDVGTIIRSFLFSGMGAFAGAMITPVNMRYHPSLAPVFIGAISGWLVAAWITESRSATGGKAVGATGACANTFPRAPDEDKNV